MNSISCKGCGEIVMVDITGEGFDDEEVERKFAAHVKKHTDLEDML